MTEVFIPVQYLVGPETAATEEEEPIDISLQPYLSSNADLYLEDAGQLVSSNDSTREEHSSDSDSHGSSAEERAAADGSSEGWAASPDFLVNYYWNEAFQLLLERPVTTPEELDRRRLDTDQLFHDFRKTALPHVVSIINEVHLPVLVHSSETVSNSS